MAPRPRTYGIRRSYVKPAGETVDGLNTDKSEEKTKSTDTIATRTTNEREKDLGKVIKGGTVNLLSQVLDEENEIASGTPDGERTIPHSLYDEHGSTSLISSTSPRRNERTSARDISPPDRSFKRASSRCTRIRKPVNGSTTESQNHIAQQEFQSIPINITSPSQANGDFRPNGFTEDHEQSPVRGIDLNERPSDVDKLALWIAQLIRRVHQDNIALTAVSEPRQEDSNPQPSQDIEMSDAVEKGEFVRMTRGKEKKRLQQLKARESANDSNGKLINGVERPLNPKDAAPVVKGLKDKMNEELKERLFGSSSLGDVPTDIFERNTCGRLLLNTIADLTNSIDCNFAAVLNSALEERIDDAPFLSALETLASSSQVMDFINFVFDNEDALRWEASNANDSRHSTGSESSGATTITETSDLASRADTSMSDVEDSKSTNGDKAIENKYSKKQKRSQEVTQALEAATMVLIQIQKGEAGADYFTPNASGSMFQNPIGQRQLIGHGVAYESPPPHLFNHAMAWGFPAGANANIYASPYAAPLAVPSNSYASPYSNPLNKPPANYASPYAHPIAPNQTSVNGLVNSVDNQATKHNSRETRQAKGETLIPHHKPTKAEARKGSDEVARRGINKQKEVARRQSKEVDDQNMSNGKDETSKVSDEDTHEDNNNDKNLTTNVVELYGKDVGNGNKKQRDGQDESSRDDDLTDNELPTVMPRDKNVTPPAEDHRLFTGERLGDFTSMENIDWLLTVGNGGKIPTPSKKKRTSSPSQDSSFPVDAEVTTEVSKIINEIVSYKDRRSYPGATIKQIFYASAEGQRLAVELRRLIAIAKPVVNAIIPVAESQARLRFYQQLQGRAMREKRDREIQRDMQRIYGAPIQIQQWIPPSPRPPAPVAIAPAPLPVPPTLPSNGPTEVPFVRRGYVIAAPPGGRNMEEEKKADTYGFPPKPGSPQGRKRKRTARR